MELVILFCQKALLRESNNLHNNSENNNGNENRNHGRNRNNANKRNNPNSRNNNEEEQPGQSRHPGYPGYQGQLKLRDQYPKIDKRTRLLALRHPKRITSGLISPTNQPEVAYRLAEVAAKSEASAAAAKRDQTAARKESKKYKNK
ncbi:GL12966 [Drosophila persimilis]|uniref:GL12966 n=1 Tax=Drosophila persimilis TaxID=7234 RepID=B4GVH8_DROPE|nr:GL12966 [Drosophila persimilis]